LAQGAQALKKDLFDNLFETPSLAVA